MSSPRRLWTGDWEQDSAQRAEELAERRRLLAGQPEPPAEPTPEPPDDGRRPSVAQYLVRALRALAAGAVGLLRLLGAGIVGLVRLIRRANARVAAGVALAVVLIVALAFALSALFGGGNGANSPVTSAAVAEAERWLGVQLAPLAHGGVSIETVNQSGAGAYAGLEPGDVISQIDNHSIFSLGDAARAIDGLSPGDQALITVNRGSAIYSTSFPMPPRPGGP
jgi:serine protease DegQ